VKNTLITAVEEFVREIWQYFPCLHRIRDEYVCGIAKSLHMTGHYGQRSGEHEGMEPPPNTLNLVIQRIRDLKDIVRCHFIQIFVNFHDVHFSYFDFFCSFTNI
jgi:hypothetical protein